MKDSTILDKYKKKLPALILNQYHILITAYILVLLVFCFTDYYVREIPSLVLSRLTPIFLGFVLLITKYSRLKNNRKWVIVINDLFCMSLLMMGFIILIITFYTPIFKSSISAVIMITVSVYFLVKGRKSIIIVFTLPLLFIILYIIFSIKPMPLHAQELMNPLAIYLGTFLVSYFHEKSRIKEFGLVSNLKQEKNKTQQLLLEKQIQNEKIEDSRNELKILNTNKDRFFSILAHDLKNPIATFQSHTELMTENFEAYSEKEKIELIKITHKSISNIYNLLDNLLKWAKLQTQQTSFNPETISCKSLIENSLEIIEDQAKLKNITIRTEIEENIMCFADKNMINSILRNLISNAIKFSYVGSEIHIKCSYHENNVKFSVIDNGVGISRNDQEKLFKIENFISRPGTINEEGTGLGLILCKEFTEKNGGNIWVESELNKGSSFIFTIPVK